MTFLFLQQLFDSFSQQLATENPCTQTKNHLLQCLVATNSPNVFHYL